MTPATQTRPAPRASIGDPPRRAPDLAAGALLVAAVSAATCWLLALPTSHLAASEALYGALAVVLLQLLPPAQRPGIGPANRVTLARAALVLPVFALALRPPAWTDAAAWWVVAVSMASMSLDFLDGRVARATGSSSAFGARFDMETDALLLLALSMLLAHDGKVGAWVILIGGLRYLFVFAGMLWPVLNGPLPASMRRKTVCVWQGVSLLLALAPITSARGAQWVAGTALAVLVYSFAVDVAWLLVHGETDQSADSAPERPAPAGLEELPL